MPVSTFVIPWQQSDSCQIAEEVAENKQTFYSRTIKLRRVL